MQASRFLDVLQTEKEVQEYQQSYVNHLVCDEPDWLKTTVDDIFLSDFVSDDPKLQALGIKGVQDVRKWVINKLRAMEFPEHTLNTLLEMS